MTIRNGRINMAQIERIHRHFLPLDDSITRIPMTHHPFDLAEFGVDLLLSGHLHATHAMKTSARHPMEGFSALVVQAG